MSFHFFLRFRFGFVRNAAVTKSHLTQSDEDQPFFVHSTGGMFCLIPNYYLKFISKNSNSTNQNDTINSNNNNNNKNGSPVTSTVGSPSSSSSTLNSNEKGSSSILCRKVQPKSNQIEKLQVAPMENLSNEKISPISDEMCENNNKKSNKITSERSRTKSHHFQYLKLNEYSVNSGQTNDQISSSHKSDDLMLNNNNVHSSPDSHSDGIINETILEIQHKIDSDHHHHHNLVKKVDNKKYIPFYDDPEIVIGFLWSWNFMLSKSWRSKYTSDETFQDNMLSDFKNFSSNHNNRLNTFFSENKTSLITSKQSISRR
jgi:hypothetical protein